MNLIYIFLFVVKGRTNKGSIYVFPADKNAYANSIYSIAVNSISPNGGIPEKFGEDCACTLTSTYGEGSQKHIKYMVTFSICIHKKVFNHLVVNCFFN